jgi:hypothetical protein
METQPRSHAVRPRDAASEREPFADVGIPAARASAGAVLNHHEEWQPLWRSELAKPWNALAVVGTDSTADACVTAEILARVGNRLGNSVRVMSAAGATRPEAHGIAEQVAAWSDAGTHLIVACDPLRTNTSMLPVLEAATGVVLVVRLGESLLASARHAVSTVGRDRIFATIAIG